MFLLKFKEKNFRLKSRFLNLKKMNDALKNEKFKAKIKRVLKKSVEYEKKKSRKRKKFQKKKKKINPISLTIFPN